MAIDLSIIIPCFNCQETLTEAVESCFTQGLDNFEIVMVDDCSTDNTKDVMKNLADKHVEIKLFYHKKNKGGGATRNFAIKNTSGDVIFCLDSDDILPAHTLSKMFNFLKEKKCDGVAIHRSIKFNGKNIKDVEIVHTFGYAGECIPIEALIETSGGKMNPLYSTFMHTRNSFEITGGYPEDHGFDTQSFAWRFLANGLTAYTCPDSEYLHRINFHKSYYIREAEGGRVNHNWFKILDEFLFLFSDTAKKKILSFKFNDYTKNIYNQIKNDRNIFVGDVENHVKHYCKNNETDLIYNKKENERSVYDLYWLGSELFRRGNFLEAEKFLRSAKEKGFRYQIVDEKLYLCKQISLNGDAENIIKKHELSKKSGLPVWKIILKKIRDKVKRLAAFLLAVFAHIEARKNNKKFLYLCFHLFLSRGLKLLKYNFEIKSFDKEDVDILIVTTSKDYLLLETYLHGLKENLCQNIHKIYLVSFPKQEIIDFCKSHNIIFVDERKVLGYGKESINYMVNGIDRSGWMLQQLIKLYGDTVVEKENFLSVCSDTILVNKNSFINKGRFIFFENEEWHETYFKNFKKIFGYDTKNKLSFTSHMMIFNAKKLQLMREELEKKNNMSWDKAYMSTMNDKDMSCISDYDTYANWVFCNFPEEVITEPLYNTSLKRSQLSFFKENLSIFKNKYKTVSFHSFIKD